MGENGESTQPCTLSLYRKRRACPQSRLSLWQNYVSVHQLEGSNASSFSLFCIAFMLLHFHAYECWHSFLIFLYFNALFVRLIAWWIEPMNEKRHFGLFWLWGSEYAVPTFIKWIISCLVDEILVGSKTPALGNFSVSS